METPPYLKSSEFSSRKNFNRPGWFQIVLALSLGLNGYFIFQEHDAPQARNSNEVEVAQQQMMTPIPTKTQPSTLEPLEEKSESFKKSGEGMKVRQASFSSPEHMGGGEVHFLHVKIRNSMNYTLCKVLTKEQGCSRLSAYVGRLFAWFFDINSKMRNGDTLSLVYQQTEDEEQFRVLNLVYQSEFFNKTFEANYYKSPNSRYGSYFDNEGQEIAKRIIDRQTPVKEYIEITSLPGDFRKKQRRGHSGTDFKAEVGTPVFASFPGKVTRINWNTRANGYCIEIDHPREGIKTLYLHLSRVLVKRGSYVRQGDQIAESGNTGRTFAPHLHYEVKHRDNKNLIYNPFKFKHIKSYYRKIPQEDLLAFQEAVRFYNSVLQTS